METGDKYKTFENRREAAELLVPLLEDLKGSNPLVLAIPRGAVPMAKVVADALNAQMDLILVSKIRHPLQPEFAIGAVSENGEIMLQSSEELSQDEIEEAALKEIELLQKRRHQYTHNGSFTNPRDRTVIVIDDGIATGATMTAAVRGLKSQGARRIIVAVPVASAEAVLRLESEGADVRAYYVPQFFGAVSYFYKNFNQVSDAEVGEYFQLRSFDIEIYDSQKTIQLKAVLGRSVAPHGIVLFAHGSGSGRLSPRNQFLADIFNRQGIATLLADLLTEEEAADRSKVFDVQLLSQRLLMLTQWVLSKEELKNLPIGYFGASTGAAAAALAAARLPKHISALVSRGGRPDLALEKLDQVQCPTLLLVGGDDHPVIELNEKAYEKLACEKNLEIIPRATHLFEEPGTLEQVADHSLRWFTKYFSQARIINPDIEPPLYP